MPRKPRTVLSADRVDRAVKLLRALTPDEWRRVKEQVSPTSAERTDAQ